ncbi:ecaf40f7-8081-4d3f-8ec9-2b18812b9e0b [Sclerotinia trifoliorum]|uniref:Ecaf40f7-8081-4d3f-8ec9-2b18812b9e0b n=1 Tax=Sclerotinia trifoliorum TaxID=28548 RepID=A0A8H2VYX0_9HELO|nr:ecaf40f7-8081-4d3f-8ec9-2b18812b9e0b [Sclerotinia trifoliorum]
MTFQEALSPRVRIDSFWSDDDTLKENEEVLDLECMGNMDYDIDRCASFSLPDMLFQQVKIEEFWNLSDSLSINQNCDGPLSRFKNFNHYFNSTTSAGVVSHMITGIHKLIHLKARGDPVELEALKYIDFNTLELSVEPRAGRNTFNASDDQSQFQINVKASKTYVFMASFKLFTSKYIYSPTELNPEIFCTLNRFLRSSGDDKASRTMGPKHSEQYFGLSNQCQCKIGVHSWLKGFIQQINSRDRKAGKSENPIYHISRLYLRFINRNCFGEQSKQVTMILLQSFGIKWMHYMVLPFDENEEEFQEIMSKPIDMPIRKLPKYLEKVLARNLDRIIAHSNGNDIQLNNSSYDSYSEVNNVDAAAISSQTNGRKPKPNPYEDIRDTKLLLNSVSSQLEPILVSHAQNSPDCVNEENPTGASTSPGFHSEISRSNGSCERRPVGTGPTSTLERRNSCLKCSTVWFWNKECDICGWKLVQEDFSNRRTQAPKMTKMFNKTKISKRGCPGCYICEKPEFLGLCHNYGFRKSLPVVSDEWSTMSELSRSASPDKKKPRPERKDPSPDTNSCPQCGALEFYGICYICSYGMWIAPSTMKRKSPTLDCNNDTAEDFNRTRITKGQDQMVFRNFMDSHQTRHRCVRLGRLAMMIKKNGRNPRLATQMRRRLASRWKYFAPQTAMGVPKITSDEYLRVTRVFSETKVSRLQTVEANPHATSENNQEIRHANILEATSTTQTDNEVYVNTTQYPKVESPDEYYASSRHSKEESPNTSRSNYLTLVKKSRSYNTQPQLENPETRIVDSCIPIQEGPEECELPPVSLVRRGTQWLSAFPCAMAVGIRSLLGFRKVRSLYDEEAAVDIELPRWLDEDVDSFRCKRLRF